MMHSNPILIPPSLSSVPAYALHNVKIILDTLSRPSFLFLHEIARDLATFLCRSRDVVHGSGPESALFASRLFIKEEQAKVLDNCATRRAIYRRRRHSSIFPSMVSLQSHAEATQYSSSLLRTHRNQRKLRYVSIKQNVL